MYYETYPTLAAAAAADPVAAVVAAVAAPTVGRCKLTPA